MLQPSDHLGAPLLNLHQFVNTYLVLEGPKPDMVSGCRLTSAEQREIIPSPQWPRMLSTSFAVSGAAGSCSARCLQRLQCPFSRAQPQLALHRGFLFLQVQPVLTDFNLHVPAGPFPRPVYFPLNGSSALICLLPNLAAPTNRTQVPSETLIYHFKMQIHEAFLIFK